MELNAKSTRKWSILGPRATYGMELLDMVSRRDDVYALSADLGISSGLSRMMSAYPDRFLNSGIAEQNLIGICAGLAKEGLVPFASSFAPFITHRCADQVRMNMGYMHLNIKTVGLASGVSMGTAGNSHFGLDDLSFMRAIPGMTILSPCDCGELVKSLNAAADYEGPVYIRLTGEAGMPRVYEDDFEYEIGKSITLREGEDVLIIATGSMVYVALKAADILSENGISAKVVDMHTIKPLDTSSIDDIAKSTRLIVTLEEHSINGGLGTAVSQYVAGKSGLPRVSCIGLPEEYLKVGQYSYILEKYGLTPDQVAKRIQEEV